MEVFYSSMFFIFGSVLASFYCVLATRIPEGKSIVKPRSHCEHCNHTLKWYELIPIFSYLFLRGKCRECHKKIPIYEEFEEYDLSHAIGKQNKVVIGVCDDNFSKEIIKILNGGEVIG